MRSGTATHFSSRPIFANFWALGFRPRAALLTRCCNTAPRALWSSRRARAVSSCVAREHAQIARASAAAAAAGTVTERMEREPGAVGPARALEPLRHLREALRAALSRIREGESRESSETFEQQRFWDTLGQTFKATSQEATKLSLAFSRPPLPSAEDCQKLSDGVQNAVLAAAAVYYWLPKDQGTTLRKMVRDATAEVVEGMIQLTDVILSTPLQSLSQEQLISTGSIWEACEQISHLPQDNQAAVLSAMSAYLGVVRDAVEEMEQAQGEDQDPYSDIMEDEELGSRGNRDTYWSEADRKLLGPCMGLMKASKACLKKLLGAVKVHGKADTPEQVAQLDDLADITNEISPSVDELALSMYPPMNQLAVRLNAAKLASVLKKVLEITKASHVCPPSEEGWVQFLTGAVDHNMDKIKDFTQSEL